MKRHFTIFSVSAVLVFLISFVTGGDIPFFSRVIGSLVVGAIVVFLTVARTTSTKATASPRKAKNKEDALYVFEIDKQQFKYKIENGYIYKGMDRRFSYQIKDGKIYEGMSASPLLVIEHNKVYKYTGNRTVLYKVVKDKVYKGELGNIPLYILKNSPYR